MTDKDVILMLAHMLAEAKNETEIARNGERLQKEAKEAISEQFKESLDIPRIFHCEMHGEITADQVDSTFKEYEEQLDKLSLQIYELNKALKDKENAEMEAGTVTLPSEEVLEKESWACKVEDTCPYPNGVITVDSFIELCVPKELQGDYRAWTEFDSKIEEMGSRGRVIYQDECEKACLCFWIIRQLNNNVKIGHIAMKLGIILTDFKLLVWELLKYRLN